MRVGRTQTCKKPLTDGFYDVGGKQYCGEHHEAAAQALTVDAAAN